MIPNGAIKGAHFLKTPSYVQVTGVGDLTKINVRRGDEGGELDPHGATGSGNPVGGLVYSRAFRGSFERVYEWQNFISDSEFCCEWFEAGRSIFELQLTLFRPFSRSQSALATPRAVTRRSGAREYELEGSSKDGRMAASRSRRRSSRLTTWFFAPRPLPFPPPFRARSSPPRSTSLPSYNLKTPPNRLKPLSNTRKHLYYKLRRQFQPYLRRNVRINL